MLKTVVITEKPSVAQELAKVMDPGARRGNGCLEGNQVWTWALGHLGELAGPEAYEPGLREKWRLEFLPVIPERTKLQTIAGKKVQFRVVQKLLAQADHVVVATDAGREGELIWEYIRELTGYRGSFERLWLSETTPVAVKKAFGELRTAAGMRHLAQAARSRALADWIVGMNGTMALTARHGGLLSVGRVQTPTLGLIVVRELEIRNFDSQDYFEVTVALRADAGVYAGKWFRGKVDRLEKRAEADVVVRSVQGKTGMVTSLEAKETKEAPPMLFNLNDLQKEANRRFGFSAKKTLDFAQFLYENHLITYPRTDSRHLSSALVETLSARLKSLSKVNDYAPFAEAILKGKIAPGKRVVDDSKVTDHHALIPTDLPPNQTLKPEALKVYDLVVRRFLAAFLLPARYRDTVAVTEVEGERFRSRGRVVLDRGWRAVCGEAEAKAKKGEEKEKEDETKELPPIKKGDGVACREAKVLAKKTKPPARYTEASLLTAMETAGKLVNDEELAEAMKDRGLGTPATRAAIIETIIHREYVKREGKALVPTKKGEKVLEVAPEGLRCVETTGEWEKQLRDIEGGKVRAEDFVRGIADYTRYLVDQVRGQKKQEVRSVGEMVGKCPLCGGAMAEGPKSYGCSNWKPENGGCKFTIWKEVGGKTLSVRVVKELLAKGETAKAVKGFKSREGKAFDARIRLDREKGKVVFIFDDIGGSAGGAKEVLGKCPLCGGDVVPTSKGYGCSNWKEKGCKFIIWGTMSEKKITPAMAKALLAKGEIGETKGFKSRAGKEFSAGLKLTAEGKVELVFKEREAV